MSKQKMKDCRSEPNKESIRRKLLVKKRNKERLDKAVEAAWTHSKQA